MQAQVELSLRTGANQGRRGVVGRGQESLVRRMRAERAGNALADSWQERKE